MSAERVSISEASLIAGIPKRTLQAFAASWRHTWRWQARWPLDVRR
jgi:hypothetical protein